MNWVCCGERLERLGEPADVGLVERRVDLVQHAERGRPDLEHREQQRDGGQRPLAAGEHGQRLRLLARRSRGDLDPGRREVGRVGEREPGEAAAEQLLEPGVEGDLEGGERRPELGRDELVEVGDQRPRPGDGVAQVAMLRLERLEALADRRGTRRRRTGWRHRARGTGAAARRAVPASAARPAAARPTSAGASRSSAASRAAPSADPSASAERVAVDLGAVAGRSRPRPPASAGVGDAVPAFGSSSMPGRLGEVPQPDLAHARPARPAPARAATSRLSRASMAATSDAARPVVRRRAAARARPSPPARRRRGAPARLDRRRAAPRAPRARAPPGPSPRRSRRRPRPLVGRRPARGRRAPSRSPSARRDAALGQRRGGLRAGAPGLGVATGALLGRRLGGQADRAASRSSASARLPGADGVRLARRPDGTPAVVGSAGRRRLAAPPAPARARSASAASRSACARVPGRLAGRRLERPAGGPLRLLGPAPVADAAADSAARAPLERRPRRGDRRRPRCRASRSAASASRLQRLGLARQPLGLGPALERRVAAPDPDRERVERPRRRRG